MNLFKEISDSLGLDEVAPMPYLFSVNGKGGGYFQNIKRLGDVKTDKIVLVLKRGEIVVSGESLAISRFTGSDVAIKGRIKSVEVKA